MPRQDALPLLLAPRFIGREGKALNGPGFACQRRRLTDRAIAHDSVVRNLLHEHAGLVNAKRKTSTAASVSHFYLLGAHTKGLRDPVEDDAELSLHALGFALRYSRRQVQYEPRPSRNLPNG
jgi:hypothetical protein